MTIFKGLEMLEIIFNGAADAKPDVKIIGFSEGQGYESDRLGKFLDKAELKILEKAFQLEDFSGKKDEFLEIYSENGKILCVGLGCGVDNLSLRQIGGSIVKKISHDRLALFYVDDIRNCRLTKEQIAHCMAYGMLLGSYSFDKYFTTKKDSEYPRLEKVCFSAPDSVIELKNFLDYASLANAVRYARDLVNEPANRLTPELFAEDIKRLSYLNLDVKILDVRELRREQFNLLLAAAQGAANAPKVAVITWRGDKSSDKWAAALVGKGVTYDAGGINLKTGKNLVNMHFDMAGAAAVVATLKSLAVQRRVVNVAGIVGLMENMPSGSALRPNDVIISMSGQTVEIRDTDGEGRLMLADLLCYAQKKFSVKNIVDIATLTGTVEYALGGLYAGIYGNDDRLIRQLTASGEAVGEKLWRLPLDEEFDKWINSDVADMKNVGRNIGDGSQAAAFLQRYINKGTRWAHIDMDGCQYSDEDRPLYPKGATGYGVQLLNHFVKTYLAK